MDPLKGIQAKMKKEGFKQANKFTWRKTAEGVLEIYEDFKQKPFDIKDLVAKVKKLAG